MIWWQSLVLLFGVLTVLLLVGLPAGFAFLAINLVGEGLNDALNPRLADL